jgi:hypothetical protein
MAYGTLEGHEHAYRVWKGELEGKLPFSSLRNRLDNINSDSIVVVTETKRCVQMF